MTIWYYEPPQGFSSEQGLSIIGRPIHTRFDPPQGEAGGAIPPPPVTGIKMEFETPDIDMQYEVGTLEMEYEDIPVGSWVELGRETLLSSAKVIEANSIANKKYLMYLYQCHSAGGNTRATIQGGNDIAYLTINQYATRSRQNANESIQVNQPNMRVGVATAQQSDKAGMGYLLNGSETEKLLYGRDTNTGLNDANSAGRVEHSSKMVSTDPIERLRLSNPAGGNFGSDSEFIVLGYDPGDAHNPSNNFWKSLASKNLSRGASSILDSQEFAAKRYLWIQAYLQPKDSILPELQINNDAGLDYRTRLNKNHDVVDSTFLTEDHFKLDVSPPTAETAGIFVNLFFMNKASRIKVGSVDIINSVSSDTATPPDHFMGSYKWVNIGDQITRLTFKSGTESFGELSFLKIWGSN